MCQSGLGQVSVTVKNKWILNMEFSHAAFLIAEYLDVFYKLF